MTQRAEPERGRLLRVATRCMLEKNGYLITMAAAGVTMVSVPVMAGMVGFAVSGWAAVASTVVAAVPVNDDTTRHQDQRSTTDKSKEPAAEGIFHGRDGVDAPFDAICAAVFKLWRGFLYSGSGCPNFWMVSVAKVRKIKREL